MNYYRVNHRNAPFNDRHVIWGMRDNALLTGNLSGLDRWVTDLSVRLYPDDDHWVMIEKYKELALDTCAGSSKATFQRILCTARRGEGAR